MTGRRKRIPNSAGTAAQQDIEKTDRAAKVPLITEEGVEEARDWVNEHEL
ncbi:MAG TPA: DUF3787 domain-containing protein [Thermoclostridium sp.]|nr:DUF3787 domain-containing protein [Clostridiaceae bacterium]HOQ75127.1 DUF3787 domain-containing protein [Thermoclostridium sp.]HPU45923.1 DUF3787 domain-containing protein [Thermoclostridium sp.]